LTRRENSGAKEQVRKPSCRRCEQCRWLITGGCGFIGTRLIKDLVAEGGHFIRVVDNLSMGTREDLARVCDFVELDPLTFSSPQPQNILCALPATQETMQQMPGAIPSSVKRQVELIVADVLDDQIALKAAEGIDVIVHLAASTGIVSSVKDPRRSCMINVIGTLNYLEAARQNQVQRFVFASSGAPVGECELPIHEERVPHPVSPYGASKLAGEGYCSAYYKTFGVETVALRFSNVYGPGSNHKNSVVAKFIRRAMRGEDLEIYSDGKQTRDFIYIDDLIQAIFLSTSVRGIGGEILQIATNVETSVSELVNKLLSILADSGHKDVGVRHGSPRLGDVRRNFSDTSKAHEMLGWYAKIELTEGLKRTVEWFLGKDS
jgi:UDP-glucose 4-epimerase